MSDILYPVPQPPVPVQPPARFLQRITAAPVVLTSREIIRAHASEVTAEWPIPRRAFMFGLRLVTAAPVTSIPTVRRAQGVLDAPPLPRRSFMFGLPQVVAAPGTGSGLLLSDQRNRLVRGG